MFDQILDLVKQHIGNNPAVSQTIPPEQQEEVHKEIATHITNGLANQSQAQGGGGILSQLQNAVAGGGTVTSAIEGGLVSSLASKFGLPPMATGAIAAALPGLLQKYAEKATNPSSGAANQGSNLESKIGGFFGK